MEQKDELMGIPQLIHFNAMLITGALFFAIVLMKYLGQSNSMFVVSIILLLSLDCSSPVLTSLSRVQRVLLVVQGLQKL